MFGKRQTQTFRPWPIASTTTKPPTSKPGTQNLIASFQILPDLTYWKLKMILQFNATWSSLLMHLLKKHQDSTQTKPKEIQAEKSFRFLQYKSKSSKKKREKRDSICRRNNTQNDITLEQIIRQSFSQPPGGNISSSPLQISCLLFLL